VGFRLGCYILFAWGGILLVFETLKAVDHRFGLVFQNPFFLFVYFVIGFVRLRISLRFFYLGFLAFNA